VGRARPRRSASSLTPSRRGPLASAFKIAVARSMDWIEDFRILSSFGIAEFLSVV
jgi:hypothetical protein